MIRAYGRRKKKWPSEMDHHYQELGLAHSLREGPAQETSCSLGTNAVSRYSRRGRNRQ